MKQFKTMLTADYVPDWTVEDGVREVIANALDSPNQMVYEITDNSITITSVGVTLPPSVLALGKSGNRHDSEAVGKHGEGLLVGMIPILREGLTYKIENGDKIWIPSFQFDEDLQEELLVINEYPNPNKNTNYSVEIIGLTEDQLYTIKQRCLYLQEDLGEVVECDMGRLLLNRSGEVFVGGIWVCNESTFKYSYDFHPKVMPINRDRKTLSNWDLKINASKLLSKCLNSEQLATDLVDRTGDVSYYNYAYGVLDDEVSDVVFEKLSDKYEEGVVFASDYSHEESLTKQGYKNVEVILNEPLYKALSNSPKYQEYLERCEKEEGEVEKSLAEQFEDWYKTWVEDECGKEEWEELIDKLNDL